MVTRRLSLESRPGQENSGERVTPPRGAFSSWMFWGRPDEDNAISQSVTLTLLLERGVRFW